LTPGNVQPFLRIVASETRKRSSKSQNISKMNKKTARVTIALKRNFYCNVEYDTLEDLVSSVNELFFELDYNGDSTTITLPECDGGRTYPWNVTAAHYCFAKGRITETQFVDEMFKEENAL
jgi:hypothetical protein